MDKLLYVSFENSENRASGVNKKIAGQMAAFKEKGFSVDLIAVHADDIAYFKDGEAPSIQKSTLLPRITLCSWVAKQAENYKVAYIRFQFFCPFVLKMVKALHRNGVITIMEIPTYPYENELVAQGLKGIPKRLIDSTYGPYCASYIDAFASPLYGGKILGKQAIEIYNGINAENISPRKPRQEDTISLLAVAMMAPWHGYDRIIEGMHNYYENGGKREIVLHLVGEGAATPEYQKLIDKYSLGEHVVQHGRKFGEELEAMYDIADIGVGALSSSLKQVYKTNTLKVLEYMAKGLPVICEEGEVGIPKDSKYRLSIAADQTPVDIEAVVQFYDSIYKGKDQIDTVINEIRSYCIENCSVADGLKGVFDRINATDESIGGTT